MLAIFPVDGGDPGAACRAALAAAEEARAAFIARFGARGLGIGIALHLGEVMYGNIGARERLVFTVIGHAVNEVCRVESLGKDLGVPLMTERFAAATGCTDVRHLGARPLKGVTHPPSAVTLDRFAAL